MPSAVAWLRSIRHFVDLLKTMSSTSQLTDEAWNWDTVKERPLGRKKAFPRENE